MRLIFLFLLRVDAKLPERGMKFARKHYSMLFIECSAICLSSNELQPSKLMAKLQKGQLEWMRNLTNNLKDVPSIHGFHASPLMIWESFR